MSTRSGGAGTGGRPREGPVRVLALWSPDWPVTAAARAAGVPLDRPVAVLGSGRVLVCSAVARTHGVRRGLRRREAQARCPGLAVLHPDAERDARLFEPVVLAVEELAPGVEVVRPGLVALPARGPTRYFGGEQQAAERLVDQVAARTGVECQVGIAEGLFAAVLAARRGVAVTAGDTPAFLGPLGVEELDREPEVDRSELVDLLRRLGLRSLGSFGALTPQEVASRFGADAVLAHRLARGLDPRPPMRRFPPEELEVGTELDPPVDRVDAAAFAARGLAERLHDALAAHGLSCTRLGIAARTASGEELHRVWRCAEPLTPAGTVDRVRWQLDAWLARGGSGTLGHLRLVPEETVAAGALQLGLWGGVGEADERAGRALVRVQALLGPDAVVTGVLVGGRDPAERVRLVPWGDERPEPAFGAAPADAGAVPGGGGPGSTGPVPGGGGAGPAGLAPVPGVGPGYAATPDARPEHAVSPAGSAPPDGPGGPARSGTAASTAAVPAGGPPAGRARVPSRRPGSARPPVRRTADPGRAAAHETPPSWPGRLPAPSPATVPVEPLPAEVLDEAGRPVRLAAPDLLTALPHSVAVDGGTVRAVIGWAGPWPVVQRWWAPEAASGSRLQVTCADGGALLLVVRGGRWWVSGVYD